MGRRRRQGGPAPLKWRRTPARDVRYGLTEEEEEEEEEGTDVRDVTAELPAMDAGVGEIPPQIGSATAASPRCVRALRTLIS